MKPIYAVTDIETTGGNTQSGKITEIAIYLFDGEKVIDEFVSLINPDMKIPPFITNLTGINNEMVAEAPRFYEVAKQIIEFTEGAIFVAHNVGFDYGFIKEEFRRLGYKFVRNRVCTVQLSRKIIPGHKSYSLGNLCKSLGLQLENRHRASGDARATVELLKLLLEKNPEIPNSELVRDDLRFLKFNTFLSAEVIEDLPEMTGVYYFHNEGGEIIYIGKSKNIRNRVISHLNNDKTKRAIKMRSEIASISIELTGSELVALLLESDEIKKHLPIYNRALRRDTYRYGLYLDLKEDSYHYLTIRKAKKGDGEFPLMTYSHQEHAKRHLFKLVERYGLCQKLCGLYKTDQACFQYQVKQCKGACIGEESVEDYNQKIQNLLDFFSFKDQSFIIVEQGRNPDELSVVKVENGSYAGFGFIDKDVAKNGNYMLISDVVKYRSTTRDAQQILLEYQRKKGKAMRLVKKV